MSKQISSFFLAIILLLVIIVGPSVYSNNQLTTAPLNDITSENQWLKILLIPLDSRPPCMQFVEELADIIGIKIITPPTELLDNYKSPGNKNALRSWLLSKSPEADAAIISTDMLIHGGLLASRLSLGSEQDINDVIQLLTTIHNNNPNIKLYVFNIIPRLLLADSPANADFQKKMLQYSVLKDKSYTFDNPNDFNKLETLEMQIPAEIIEKYQAMNEQNTKLSLKLIDMTEQGILSSLILGQDDGQPFGIANINKQYLQNYLDEKPSLNNKVFITRGTDEVGLTLLGHIIAQLTNYHPRIFVTYSDDKAPFITMPFMPHTVAKTAEEKINIADGIIVDNKESADFILYIHVGTKNNKNTLYASAEQVKNLLADGYKVAVVDLSEDFSSDESLLPILLKNNIDVHKLIAYAGWNTTSNSIGTAVTEAVLFTNAINTPLAGLPISHIYKKNLEFITSRFLDDLFYQKDIFPQINKELLIAKINPNNLGDFYQSTNDKIQDYMQKQSIDLFNKNLSNKVLVINAPQGSERLLIKGLEINTHLPWTRTFEISINSSMKLEKIVDK